MVMRVKRAGTVGDVRTLLSPVLPRCTVVRVDDAEREVLKFIGDEGKTAEQVADRFPAFDVEGLVRAELARPRRTTQSRRAPAAPDPTFYVLTSRGAEAIGLDPHTLHSA